MVLLDGDVKLSAKNIESSANKICSLIIHRKNIHVCMCVFVREGEMKEYLRHKLCI